VPATATLLTTCCALGLAFALTRRPATTLLLVLWLLGALLLSSAIMQSLLGMPLTLADVQFFFRDPFDDLKLFFNYPKLGFAFIGVLAGLPLLLLLGLRFEPPRWPQGPWPLAHWGGRLLLAIACVGVLVAGWRAAPDMAHAGEVDNRDAWSAFLAMRRQETAQRWLDRLDVFFENRDMLASLPAARVQTRFALPGAAAPLPPAVGPQPDILMVLEESTFDPWLIAACRALACDSPMFQPPGYARRVLQGPLLVQTTGGGTWLTEFAFLSGLDWRSFGRGGAYAPVSLAPRLQHALPQTLRDLGYHTVVVAPTGGDFLHARVAYRNYGFDEFYSADDLHLKGDWHAQHDGLVFERALAAVQVHPDPRPLFLYVLTIRNHGPHGDIRGTLPSRYAVVQKQLGMPLADYLERLDDSARELDALRRSWLASPRARVIGWFGDHQPEVAWDFLDTPADTRAERLAPNAHADEMRFLTWQQLSANFGEPGSVTRRLATAAPYMMAELLQFAGLPLTAHEDSALQVAAACQLRLLGCADRELVDDYLSYRIHELGAVH
jgi:phosphoglycerol transferase MdoB-like AlkP superfamily enzyme